MKFTVETNYDQKTMTALAHGLRKTVRAKRSKRTHCFGWIIVVLSMLLLWSRDFQLSPQSIVTLLVVLLLIATLLWEDSINGYIARRRLLKGLDKAVTEFHEDGYETITAIGKTQWNYDVMSQIVEMNDYFLFVFDQSHGQVYAKKGITGGTVEEFRSFIEGKTKKEVKTIR